VQRQRVERGLLDCLARFLEARAALRAYAQSAEIEQALRERRLGGQRKRLDGSCPGDVSRLRVVGQAASGLCELRQALLEPWALTQLEQELASRRAQRLVDGRQHPAQAGGAVGREQPQPLRIVAGAELVQRRLERLPTDDATLAVVEHAEARVEARRERVSLQQPEAEAVDRGDPGSVERPREVVTADLA
jgi:hypothetical protein